MSNRYTSFSPLVSAWPTIFLISAVGLLLGVVLSFLRPLEYSSTTRLLITQELGSVDAYTASRSAERIADDLATAVYTSTFFDKVMASGFDIDESYFPLDETKKRKTWSKAITTSVSRSTGLLSVRAYHPDPAEAENLVSAVTSVLIEEGWAYTSGGNITVQLVDEPLNSRWPVRPNILVNAFSGFILGGLAGIGYILIQVERIKRRHQFLHEDE
ncbi:MAG: hypothetical protein Q8P30_03755 [Candidatus Uhrbacteria bacterium]|nr:hypothetical protein [Candidatus Uhrbacteria bacterium]